MKLFIVVNSVGKFFAGISEITGQAMWFDCSSDISGHASDCGALRLKRDGRWLAKAIKSDSTATWKEI